jgi:3-deoxy-D-manno-octulosonic-acid transferase
MRILYNIGIVLFTWSAILASLFNQKARLWIHGRKNWFDALNQKISSGERYVWIHCASLGEFEQGRPVIEAIKKEKPHVKVILTFFSPSGYEIRKNYQMADIICYLPADTPVNAEKFISIIDPAVVIFVKYEFWYNYLSVLGRRKIPFYLISGIFSRDQAFFKWYGTFFRKMLNNFSWFFVQDQKSYELLGTIGLQNVTVAGDTRFDRVMQIKEGAGDIPQLELFKGKEKLFLAGSSWKQDEEIITRYINKFPDRMKWVFAPHEIDSANIERLTRLLRTKYIRFSQFTDADANARVLIIDNIGMLSSAYRYADIAAVGGGFGKGIHNILEPACWSIPVLFGPNHMRFPEAIELFRLGGAYSFGNYPDFGKIIDLLITDDEAYKKSAEAAGKYVGENTGATHKIMLGIV